MNFEEIVSLDCRTMGVSRLISVKQLNFPHSRSGWIAELISSEPGGKSILLRAALRPATTGEAVSYFIARLHLEDAKVELLTALQGAFS